MTHDAIEPERGGAWLGQAVVRRLRLPGPPVGRPLPSRIGSLASAVSRFAAATSRPVDVRRALAGPEPAGQGSMRPPRWWVPVGATVSTPSSASTTPTTPTAPTAPTAPPGSSTSAPPVARLVLDPVSHPESPSESHPASDPSTAASSEAPAVASTRAPWLAPSRPLRVDRLVQRGLPRAARSVPQEQSWSPGGILGGLRSQVVQVRRHEEVAAAGPMLTQADRSRLTATASRAARTRAAASAAAVPVASARPSVARVARTSTSPPDQVPTTRPTDPSPGPSAGVPPTAPAPPSARRAEGAPPPGAPPQEARVSRTPTEGRAGESQDPLVRPAGSPGPVAVAQRAESPSPGSPPGGWRPHPARPRFATALRRTGSLERATRTIDRPGGGLLPVRRRAWTGAARPAVSVRSAASDTLTRLDGGPVTAPAAPHLDAPHLAARRRAWAQTSLVLRQAEAERFESSPVHPLGAGQASTEARVRRDAQRTTAPAGSVGSAVRPVRDVRPATRPGESTPAPPGAPGAVPAATGDRRGSHQDSPQPGPRPELRRELRQDPRHEDPVRGSAPRDSAAPPRRIGALSSTPHTAAGDVPRRPDGRHAAPVPTDTTRTAATRAPMSVPAPSSLPGPGRSGRPSLAGGLVLGGGVTAEARAAMAMPDLMSVRRTSQHGVRRSASLASGFGAPETINPSASGRSGGAAAIATPGLPVSARGDVELPAAVSSRRAVRRAPAAATAGPVRSVAGPDPVVDQQVTGPAAGAPWSVREAIARTVRGRAGATDAAAARHLPTPPPGATGAHLSSSAGLRRFAAPPAPRVGRGGTVAPVVGSAARRLTVAPPRISVAPPAAVPGPAGVQHAQPTASGPPPVPSVARSTAGARSLVDATARLFDPIVRRFADGGESPMTDTSMPGPSAGPAPGPGRGSGAPGAVPARVGRPSYDPDQWVDDWDDEQSHPSAVPPSAMLEVLVDAVVDRIEQRVVDELERRGRRQSWGAF